MKRFRPAIPLVLAFVLPAAALFATPLPDIAAEVSGYADWRDFTADGNAGAFVADDGATVRYLVANDRRGRVSGIVHDSQLGTLPVRGRVRFNERLVAEGVSEFSYRNRAVLRGRRGRDRVRLNLWSEGRLLAGETVQAGSRTPAPDAYEYRLRRRSDALGVRVTEGTALFHDRRRVGIDLFHGVRRERVRLRRTLTAWNVSWNDGGVLVPGRLRLETWQRRAGRSPAWRARADGRHLRANVRGTVAPSSWQPLEGIEHVPLRVERYVVRTSMARFEVRMREGR